MKTRPIGDLRQLSDAQLDARLDEWLGDLAAIGNDILKDGIAMLLTEKNRRAVARLHKSSVRIEVLTVILAILTAVLVWKEIVH